MFFIGEQPKRQIDNQEVCDNFKSLVESTSDWIWQVDENAVYSYSSPKVKDILGYTPEEVIGKTPFDFMPKKEKQKVSKMFARNCEK